MDVRQLRYFIAIAEERTITAAARRLHIAQPPLSQQLKALERELGVQLICRGRKGLELTEAGQALYRHAAMPAVQAGEGTGY
ncbi:LysR family transcriptional regulator [Paenibacillus dendritiformis]|uniref:LysR family transcriptional regulator n=1 Tax=Paenibacillus dendritiformis TaxID=130049 RepID=UPI0030B8BB55